MSPRHLKFTEGGAERLAEVRAFLDRLDEQGHPEAIAVQTDFERQLGYLDEFGGAVSNEDPRRRFEVTLGRDWAPLSFAVTWARLDTRTGEYVYAFNGGLIWHGGANDPLCVNLSASLWGVHT